MAAGGTFLLDEVAELRPSLQAKLLRVLEERRFERVGGVQTITAEVRWIAATNRDIQAATADGSFREDLYHRLAVFPIALPPLRERRDDIAPLAETLLANLARALGRPGIRLSPAAVDVLRTQRWPGNVRELANVLERALILTDGPEIAADELPLDPRRATVPSGTGTPVRSLEELERDAIAAALANVGGNRRKAAEVLGIGLRTLYDKIRRYGMS